MKTGLNDERIIFGINEVKLQPPLTESSKIMCYGGNFGDHVAGNHSSPEKNVTTEEARKGILETPIWGFYKLSEQLHRSR